MKMKLMLLVVGVGLLSAGAAFSQDGVITIDPVDGMYNAVSLDTNVQVVFWIHWENNTGKSMRALSNGFKVYSNDGAEWGSTTPDTNGAIAKAQFDFGFWLNEFSNDGMNADTVGFAGTRMTGTGLVDGFNDTAYSITIGPISPAQIGKTICVDSSYYPTTGAWKWDAAPGDENQFYPSWGGPYCYGIIEPPQGVRASGTSTLPHRFALSQNYPNPFNPTTQIAFDLPTRSQVTLTVYNVLGQQVSTLVNEKLAAGSYEADWDGRSSGGTPVASGIYFYRLHTESFTQTKKMILLK